MKTILMALVLLSLSAVDLGAFQLPLAGTTEGLGVCFPYGGTTWPSYFTSVLAEGAKSMRAGLPWALIESTQGQYDFNRYQYDYLVDTMNAGGCRTDFTLGLGDNMSFYGTDPNTAEYAQGFANYAAACADHFKGKGVTFILWNEPNCNFWPGGPNVDGYMALVNKAVPAMRAADPNCTILGPATCPFTTGSSTGVDTTFLTNCFNYGQRYPGQKGLLDLVDAVDVHAYQGYGNIYTNPAPPENVVTSTYTPLRTLINQYHPSGPVPITAAEWGYSTTMPGITAQVQADYLARAFLVNMSQGIRISEWYNWNNLGTDPNDMEANFGTVTVNDSEGVVTPKPAYYAMQLLTSSLKGETFTSRLNDSHTNDWLLVFTAPNGQQTLAAWTTRTGGRTVTVSGWGTLDLTSTPFYVDPTLLPGDANLDGKVDVLDLAILAANYRKHVTGGWLQGDFNNDGMVDVEDLALLAANYRHSYASDVVPAYDGLDAEAIQLLSLAGVTVVAEPGSLVMLTAALIGLLAYVWRKRS